MLSRSLPLRMDNITMVFSIERQIIVIVPTIELAKWNSTGSSNFPINYSWTETMGLLNLIHSNLYNISYLCRKQFEFFFWSFVSFYLIIFNILTIRKMDWYKNSETISGLVVNSTKMISKFNLQAVPREVVRSKRTPPFFQTLLWVLLGTVAVTLQNKKDGKD